MLHLHKNSKFFDGSQQIKFLWVRGKSYGFVSWEMKCLELLHTFYGIILMGEKPANNILYNILWTPVNERRARIIIPAEKKNMVAAGINP
jgi:hypothetical protein